MSTRDIEATDRSEMVCPNCGHQGLIEHSGLAKRYDSKENKIVHGTKCPECGERADPSRIQQQYSGEKSRFQSARERVGSTRAIWVASAGLFVMLFFLLPLMTGPLFGSNVASSGPETTTGGENSTGGLDAADELLYEQGDWSVYYDPDRGYYITDGESFVTPDGVEDSAYYFESPEDALEAIDNLDDTQQSAVNNGTNSGFFGGTPGGQSSETQPEDTQSDGDGVFNGGGGFLDGDNNTDDTSGSGEGAFDGENDGPFQSPETIPAFNGDRIMFLAGWGIYETPNGYIVYNSDKLIFLTDETAETVSKPEEVDYQFDTYQEAKDRLLEYLYGQLEPEEGTIPTFSGEVTDSEGTLIQNATIRINDKSTGDTEVVPAPDGTFERGSHLDAGIYTVYAIGDGMSTTPVEIEVGENGQVFVRGESPTGVVYATKEGSDSAVAQNSITFIPNSAFRLTAGGDVIIDVKG